MVEQEDGSLGRALYRTDPGFRLLVDDLFGKLKLPLLSEDESASGTLNTNGESNV